MAKFSEQNKRYLENRTEAQANKDKNLQKNREKATMSSASWMNRGS